ncbi:helix-hairpin-helix domain-containing protein [Acinetobacter lwoffii]|uniref:helix-hairpin-helix domain-containing protein n=1 Tax=Acinetobacter lwoffii TaxID=28090 RepID=UPI0013E0422D|nr:helix-hairpin-helix domain-containing protein [Acinetobacter lwoffii]NGP43014.1 helix-hairpin-helix domain-containing protein [Acinetobacter lwoffii]
MADRKAEALKIIEEGLKELESAKGSVTVGVQKLSRAAKLLNEDEIVAWSEIQLGSTRYVSALQNFSERIDEEYKKEEKPQNMDDPKFKKNLDELKELSIPLSEIPELHRFKSIKATGGYHSVEFIEERYAFITKLKQFTDHVYNLTDLKQHLQYIRKKALDYLTELDTKLRFSGTITSSFDILKNAVDDRLLDLDPEIAEQLMLAFKSVSSDSKEEWSQALATCRRLLESLADKLYPATEENIKGRTFKQNQYINRIWRFMDVSIESKSNKEMAKAHVDYLGSWLSADYSLACKGVHAEVNQLEATKAIFHIYLMLADLLDYLDPSAVSKNTKPHITEVSLDEIEALLNIRRDIAKAIVIARVNNKGLTLEQLSEVKGIGAKTLATAKEVFEF